MPIYITFNIPIVRSIKAPRRFVILQPKMTPPNDPSGSYCGVSRQKKASQNWGLNFSRVDIRRLHYGPISC
eukprot:UN23346